MSKERKDRQSVFGLIWKREFGDSDGYRLGVQAVTPDRRAASLFSRVTKEYRGKAVTRRGITHAAILALWAMVTGVYAFLYSFYRVHSPLADPGYETTYRFQLLVFALTRLPILIAALGAALAAAEFYVRRSRNSLKRER